MANSLKFALFQRGIKIPGRLYIFFIRKQNSMVSILFMVTGPRLLCSVAGLPVRSTAPARALHDRSAVFGLALLRTPINRPAAQAFLGLGYQFVFTVLVNIGYDRILHTAGGK